MEAKASQTADEMFIEFLKHAVEYAEPLEIDYEGLRRFVTPTLLGETADKGVVLHCVQFAGESSKGPVSAPEWRFLYVSRMKEAALTDHVGWSKGHLKKAEGEYKQPKFITKVLAMGKI